MARIKNINFFKSENNSVKSVSEKSKHKKNNETSDEVTSKNSANAESSEIGDNENKIIVPRKVQLSSKLIQSVKNTCVTLNEIGIPELARDMVRLYKLAINKRFTVAFVGEFSRGKTTLINKILNADILPTSDLPTTAVLTRIIYGVKPQMVVCDKFGKICCGLPVTKESWTGLTAANFDGYEEPEGSVIIQYPDKWLGEYAIDLIDTPGAGDLEEERTRIIERTMITADSAIIAIDATKPFSLTEQLFIQQKIMSRGVPFVAIAITKLDLINKDERVKVIEYIVKKLKKLKISMPIVVANDNIDIPQFDNIPASNIFIGINKLKQLVIAWMANKNRRSLMEKWLSINALTIINSARAFLLQQKGIVDANDVEREKLINQRNSALSELQSKWQELRAEMETRCKNCAKVFQRETSEAEETIIERLQHEVEKQPDPKDWLEKEYSYRVKRELSALSSYLDNLVAKHVISDIRWLNNELNNQFKEIIGSEVAAVMFREDFQPIVNEKAVELDSLKAHNTKATIVSSAVTIGAALMLGATAGAPLILATTGVGTAARLISRHRYELRRTRQLDIIKQLIAEQIPHVIKRASADSTTKLKIIYNDIISESHNIESRWITAQRSHIRNSVESSGNEAKEKLAQKIATIDQLVNLFS